MYNDRNSKMKTYQVTLLAVLAALLTTGCGSDHDGRIRLLAEHMTAASSAKILMDPTSIDAAQWVSGEKIDLCGNNYTIQNDPSTGFFVNTGEDQLPATLRAIYPATVKNDGFSNDIEITNNSGNNDVVLIHSLGVNFRDGGHDIYFPMAAKAAASDGATMTFCHLTGGLHLTLHNNSNSSVTLSSVKVVLVSADNVTPITYTEPGGASVSTSWAPGAMSLPTGNIGSIIGDVPVGKTSEMNFYLYNEGNPNVELAAGEDISLCLPVTVTSLTKVVVAGYNESHVQRFVKIKSLGSTTTIERNIMYTLPTIDIEN